MPARASCSEAMPTTSPIGESSRPAVERITTGVSLDDLDGVVIEVLVRDEDEVGADTGDRWVLEAQAALRDGRHVAERIDEDGCRPR